MLIENAFGVLKRRFGLLHQENRRNIQNVCCDAAACAILHNIAINNRLPDNFGQDSTTPAEEINIPPYVGEDSNHGVSFRNHLIANVFL